MGGDHVALRIFVEHHSKLIEPLNGVWSLHYQPAQKFRTGGKMAAAKSVQIVLHRGVVLLIRRLNTALCHHGVGVSNPQLGNNHYLSPCLMCFNSSRSACPAAADDQYVHIIIDPLQIYRMVKQAAVGMEQMPQFCRYLLAFIGTDLDFRKAVFPIVRMVGFKQCLLFLWGHAPGFQPHARLSGGFHLTDGFQHGRCKHRAFPPIFQSLWRYKAPAFRL